MAGCAAWAAPPFLFVLLHVPTARAGARDSAGRGAPRRARRGRARDPHARHGRRPRGSCRLALALCITCGALPQRPPLSSSVCPKAARSHSRWHNMPGSYGRPCGRLPLELPKILDPKMSTTRVGPRTSSGGSPKTGPKTKARIVHCFVPMRSLEAPSTEVGATDTDVFPSGCACDGLSTRAPARAALGHARSATPRHHLRHGRAVQPHHPSRSSIPCCSSTSP